MESSFHPFLFCFRTGKNREEKQQKNPSEKISKANENDIKILKEIALFESRENGEWL
jgi:hypothetical protein